MWRIAVGAEDDDLRKRCKGRNYCTVTAISMDFIKEAK